MWMNMAGCISERRWTEVRHLLLLGGSFLALTAVPCLAAGTNSVKDVRHWSAGDITRVAVEVSGDFQFKAGRLPAPARLFFDIANTIPGSPGQKAITVGDGRVKQIRVAQTEPGVTRIVVDVEDGVEYTASRLSNPERLMVELRPKGARVVAAPEPPAGPLPKGRGSVQGSVESTEPRASASGSSPAKVETAAAAPPATAPKPPVTSVASVAKAAPAAKPDPAPQPAARNSNGDRSLTRVLGLKIGKVVIDAGHGGNDQGTKGKTGLLEKDLTLDVANRVAVLLRQRLGVDVVMTRSDDTYVGLEERTEIANNSRADLFLSIHANWNPLKTVAGVDTYYRYFSAARDDLDLAARENAATTRSIFDLEDTVAKIAMRAKVDESREFAAQLQKVLHAAAAKENPEAKSRPVKRAPFVVLIGANMPSVLAEIGFLSNPKEEQLLNSSAHRDRLAEALYQGVDGYFTSLSHTEVARAVE